MIIDSGFPVTAFHLEFWSKLTVSSSWHNHWKDRGIRRWTERTKSRRLLLPI